MGGYDQELEFVSEKSVKVKIMDRIVTSRMVLDATKQPVSLDLTVDLPEGTNAGSQEPATESVLYICDVVDDELWLCSPHPQTPTTRPSEFSGVTFIKMQRGELPGLDEETKQRISTLSHHDKVVRYIYEALEIFPDGKRLMPLQSDSPEQQQAISLLNVQFQADNFKITQRYGIKVEEEVRDLLVGFKTNSDEELSTLVKELKVKMQKAMLLPPDDEMQQFMERQKDYQGELLPKDSYKAATTESKEAKSQQPTSNADDTNAKQVAKTSDEVSFKKRDLLLVAGVSLGIAAAAIGVLAVMRQNN